MTMATIKAVAVSRPGNTDTRVVIAMAIGRGSMKVAKTIRAISISATCGKLLTDISRGWGRSGIIAMVTATDFAPAIKPATPDGVARTTLATIQTLVTGNNTATPPMKLATRMAPR